MQPGRSDPIPGVLTDIAAVVDDEPEWLSSYASTRLEENVELEVGASSVVAVVGDDVSAACDEMSRK